MNCSRCNATMTSRRGDHPYTESGLDNVTLIDAEIRECACGESSTVIPRITALHRALAQHLLHEPRLLVGSEIRFLRTVLDWTPDALAQHLGFPTHTLMMWEQGFGWPQHLVRTLGLSFASADRLVRVLVAYRLDYLLDVFSVFPMIVEHGSRSELKAFFITNNWAVT